MSLATVPGHKRQDPSRKETTVNSHLLQATADSHNADLRRHADHARLAASASQVRRPLAGRVRSLRSRFAARAVRTPATA
jgi:hypothetical protein